MPTDCLVTCIPEAIALNNKANLKYFKPNKKNITAKKKGMYIKINLLFLI